MRIFKPKFWNKKNSLLSIFFLPISFLLQFLIKLKKQIIKKEKFFVPVVCVGNIYLGGTGKTPLCIELAEMLKKIRKKPAIIKKFYKSHKDEFNLIESKKIKLFKNTSRSTAIKTAQNENYNCIILDDGFQDSSVFKNLNIICFNGELLAGNEMTIPSGPLREPLSSLERAQIIIINGKVNKDFEKKIKSMNKNIKIYYSEYFFNKDLGQFKKQKLLAFAGIGNPNSFFTLLHKNNLKIAKKIYFPDHYNYSLKELKDLVNYSIKNNLTIVTTEKDYFRMKHFKIPEIQYLSVKVKINNKTKFEKELIKCLF